MPEQTTPFWLEIKTEYIDANLEKVIDYLSKESQLAKKNELYDQTERLLLKRAEELIDEISSRPVWEDDTPTEKDSAISKLRILGAFLLIREDKSEPIVRESFFCFLRLLISALPENYTESLSEISTKCLTSNSIVTYSFGWNDIKECKLEILAHKISGTCKFSEQSSPVSWFQGKGSLKIENGNIDIFQTNKDKTAFGKLAPSLKILENTIKVQTPASEKLALSVEDNIEEMYKFTQNFINIQESTIPSPVKALKYYEIGDKMAVRYKGYNYAKDLIVETIDGKYNRIEGIVPARSSAFRNIYYASTLAQFLKPGDCFDAIYKGGTRQIFDLSETFIEALVSNTVEKKEIVAILKNINTKGLMTWWTEDGYPAYVENNPGTYDIGDSAILRITGCSESGYVYALVENDCTDTFDEDESRQYCINGFVYAEEPELAPVPVFDETSQSSVKGLCRLLFRYQRSQESAVERFRILCICQILAKLTDDAPALEYIRFVSDYLRNLVFFANDEINHIKPLSPSKDMASLPSVVKRMEIIKILQAYGFDKEDSRLDAVIQESGKKDELLVKLAKLVQSSNRIDNVYPAIKSVIKRQITKYLSVETEDNTNFEEASGPNLGVENNLTEFKTSFFFAPPNAYEKNQEKNIFKDLCSFLNTQEGGTLYLGVNDSGHISGLGSDLEHLNTKVAGAYKNIDGYIRYITDRAKQYFELDERINFIINPAYDGRVVVIKVEPYEHGVVEFEGIPYIRTNSESVKMSQSLRRQIEAKRITGKSKRSKTIVALSEAIREEKKVTFFNYSSSTSDEIHDRHLEPFAFLGDYTFVWCYDLDDGKNKLFRLSRIGSLKIDDESWTCKDKHQKGKTDIFHFSGDKPIHIKLQLDLVAKNLLTEEFLDSGQDLYSIDSNNNLWILETTVYSLLGVGRFYCGLANHITIIDAPELEEYAKAYFKKALE